MYTKVYMYVYIRTCSDDFYLYISMNICIYMYTYMYIYIYTYIYIHMYTHIFIGDVLVWPNFDVNGSRSEDSLHQALSLWGAGGKGGGEGGGKTVVNIWFQEFREKSGKRV